MIGGKKLPVLLRVILVYANSLQQLFPGTPVETDYDEISWVIEEALAEMVTIDR